MPVIFNTPKPQSPSVTTPVSPMPPANISPHKHFPLASFMRQPYGIYFATQEKDEVILLFLRKHPITQVAWILAALILILLPFLLIPFVNSTSFFSTTLPPIYMTIINIVWYLLTFAFIYVKFILWYYNINIVTFP